MPGISEGALRQIAADLDANLYDPEQRLAIGGSLSVVLDEVLFHAASRYWQFTPTHTGAHHFTDRLLWWLQNEGLTTDEMDTLLRTVTHIQFVDRDDMLTLYRGAFHGQIMRWLMDQLSLDFSLTPTDLAERLRQGLDRTWFCPVTDSMDIAQFHHVNGISGADQRPSWRTLARFGETKRIADYMGKKGLDRLVLLEDFVGSGTQTQTPLRYAIGQLCPQRSVLFVPLIISAVGFENLRSALGQVDGFRLEPCFVVPPNVLVSAEPNAHEPAYSQRLRAIVLKTFDAVSQPMPPESAPLAEAFGFGSVGTLLVLHSNCPNNTLPLIWHDSPSWRSLFPRVSRH